MNTTELPNEEDDLLLAEYALGVLEQVDRQRLESRLAQQPALRERLEQWHEHLAPMLQDIPAQAPPEYVWARIRHSLEQDMPAPSRSAADARPGLWNSLLLWRWSALGGVAAALLMAVMLLLVLPADGPAPLPASMLSASLQLESGETFYTATVDADRRSLVVIPAADVELDGRQAQLWLIAGDNPPQSLGLLPADGAIRLTIPDDLQALASANSVFAVSLEPPGGSPTGLPTGPVVAQGVLADI